MFYTPHIFYFYFLALLFSLNINPSTIVSYGTRISIFTFYLWSVHPVAHSVFLVLPYILFLTIYYFMYFIFTCPRCSSRHPPPLFPHFPGKHPHFTRKPPKIKGNPSKNPPFLSQNHQKPYFLSPKPPKTPFSP